MQSIENLNKFPYVTILFENVEIRHYKFKINFIEEFDTEEIGILEKLFENVDSLVKNISIDLFPSSLDDEERLLSYTDICQFSFNKNNKIIPLWGDDYECNNNLQITTKNNNSINIQFQQDKVNETIKNMKLFLDFKKGKYDKSKDIESIKEKLLALKYNIYEDEEEIN